MTINKYFKNHHFVFLCTVSFVVTSLAASRLFAQERTQGPNYGSQVIDQPGLSSKKQISSKLPRNKHQVNHLKAKEFYFEDHVVFPPSVLTDPNRYGESITHNNNGALDITMLNQGNTIKYLFQISIVPEQQCKSDTTSACQQGAPFARGNIAEIQITLPGGKLIPGTYTFGENGSTSTEEVIGYSRQLYSDPSHGKLGCQIWGAGTFNVKKALYNVDGKLEYLDASFSRVCNQTKPFPPTLPEDNLPQVEVENIEKYTYCASWRSRLDISSL